MVKRVVFIILLLILGVAEASENNYIFEWSADQGIKRSVYNDGNNMYVPSDVPKDIKHQVHYGNMFGINGKTEQLRRTHILPEELSPKMMNINENFQGSDIMSSSFNMSGNVSLLWEKYTGSDYTYARALNDLDGDNKPDVLVVTWKRYAGIETATITAVRGYDGHELWIRAITGINASIDGGPVDDLNGDGKYDVIIYAWNRSDTTETASFDMVRGYDGYEIWNKSIAGAGARISAYPYDFGDLTGDGKPDFLVHSITTETTTLAAVRGYDGYELWNRTFTAANAQMDGYSVDDLNGDGRPDVLIGMSVFGSGSPVTLTASAVRGYDGYEFWNKSITGENARIYGYPAGNLTDDGKTDVLISSSSQFGTIGMANLTAVRGYDGYELWNRTLTEANAQIYGYSVDDLNGDGKSDVLIGMSVFGTGSPVILTASAVRGYDGYEFWNKSTMGTFASIHAYLVDDLTSDNKPDVLVNSWSNYYGYESAGLYAVRGNDGFEIWNKYFSGINGGIALEGIVDLYGDNKSEFFISINNYYGNTTGYAIRGYDGYELWNRSITGVYTPFYSFIDLTGDDKQEVLIGSTGFNNNLDFTALRSYDGYELWNLSENWSPDKPVIGWSRSYGWDHGNLTEDGINDIVIYSARTVTFSDNTVISNVNIHALRGYDGFRLWNRSVNGENIDLAYILLDWDGNGILDALTREKIWGVDDLTINSSAEVIQGNNGISWWKARSNTSMEFSYMNYDLNSDNKLDVVISTADSIHALTSAQNIEPVANCGPDKVSCENVGSPVQFNGSASYDPDGAVISYYWEFGDGTNSTGAAPKHVYSTYRWNGTTYLPFNVNLTVTDNDGLTNSSSQKVIIWIAGDSNGDGKVNILDASLVGLRWGGSNPCADLNNDGKVNILDASIIGLNWGKNPQILTIASKSY